jgi:YjbE family integral membrane protein
MSPALAAMLQVILIDIVLAGDNAVVIGIVAAKVPRSDRRKVIFWGLIAAVVLRVVLAVVTVNILKVNGLTLVGGMILLLVSWRLYRELRLERHRKFGIKTLAESKAAHLTVSGLRRAIAQIVIADLSMSLDNVLAVAGAAMNAGATVNYYWVLTLGLLLSITLMGFAASMIANLLQRHSWISYAGLIIVVYVALRMVYTGALQIL